MMQSNTQQKPPTDHGNSERLPPYRTLKSQYLPKYRHQYPVSEAPQGLLHTSLSW